MLSRDLTRLLAQEGIESWNSHNLDSILSHYSEDIEFTSPFVVKVLREKAGTIYGKDRMRSYFEKGLSAYPELNFELRGVLSGIRSITLYYRSLNDMLAAEVMILDKDSRIARVIAIYSED